MVKIENNNWKSELNVEYELQIDWQNRQNNTIFKIKNKNRKLKSPAATANIIIFLQPRASKFFTSREFKIKNKNQELYYYTIPNFPFI